MEESFELLSSMSPKVKGRQKHFRKGSTLLALKKHIRRSSIYDKSVHTKNNDELIVIEGSSSTTESQESCNSKQKLLNKTPIVISDTDFSETDNESSITSKKIKEHKQIRYKRSSKTSTSKKESPENSFLLSTDKLNDIKNWIDTVNLENDSKENITTYSDLSTIYGDEIGGNFNPEGIGAAVSSTFVKSDCMRFDQLFKNMKRSNLETDHVHSNLMIINDKLKDNSQSFNDSIIEESFVDLNESLTTRLKKETDHVPSNLTINNDKLKDNSQTLSSLIIEESFVDLNESLTTRLKNRISPNKEIKHIKALEENSTPIKERTSNDNEIRYDKDLVSMLDDLYGDKWREKEEHVLPKTEPRKRLPKQHDAHVTNTERKPKLSVLYKNPYIEKEKIKSNKLLQNLHRTRIKMYMESPLIKRLNDLCDSETDSESSNEPRKPRIKLNFENDSDSERDNCLNLNKVERTSRYFQNPSSGLNKPLYRDELNKENVDGFFPLGEPLQEIVKKNNRINTPPEGNKNKTNDGTKTPISNKVKSLRKKLDIEKGSTTKIGIPRKTITNPSSSSKGIKTKGKTDAEHNISTSSTSSDDAWEKEIGRIKHETKVVNGKYSFLASLSANVPILQCDMMARIHRNNFKATKDQLLKKLFNLYNDSVFEGAIPQDTSIEWNDRLRGTAGYCYCKKITRRTGAVERTARIVLSTKVIDAAYRLRDTLIHEMCHAATWIVNCVSDGHGPYWKAWACKAMKTFPELPPIKRCHDYTINTKYTYRCTGCGYSIGRHSKSLDIERKRCGYCMGKFEVLINKVSKKGEIKSVPATPKKGATGFALFVKENYGVYKNAHRKHGDVMKLLGQKFQEMKVNQC